MLALTPAYFIWIRGEGVLNPKTSDDDRILDRQAVLDYPQGEV
jgi:hypothetical protein